MPDTRPILADNLRHLMQHDARHPMSQAELSRRSHIDQRYIGRILAAEVSTSVDILDRLAHAFDLQAWQLLVPGLDPSNPPVNHITEAERRLYSQLREAARAVIEEDRDPYKK